MCSWVENETWHKHQRLELENDLIAAHLLHAGVLPPALECFRQRSSSASGMLTVHPVPHVAY